MGRYFRQFRPAIFVAIWVWKFGNLGTLRKTGNPSNGCPGNVDWQFRASISVAFWVCIFGNLSTPGNRGIPGWQSQQTTMAKSTNSAISGDTLGNLGTFAKVDNPANICNLCSPVIFFNLSIQFPILGRQSRQIR